MKLPPARRLLPLLGLLTTVLVLSQVLKADQFNDFDVTNSEIATSEIYQGGPPRDGIPAIDEPKFVHAGEADFLNDRQRVLGLHFEGEVKAYPINIMNWHEIVNDEVSDMAVVITYCPLCGTGVGFLAVAGGEQLNFGVSGLLYNSDVLLYDHQTNSLWSQLLNRAISGPLKGVALDPIPLEHTSWGDWRTRYPDSLVLSLDTGHRRNYHRDPYAGYETDEGLYFPVSHRDARFHPKERVLGLEINGLHKAYPFAELSRTSGQFQDRLGGQNLIIQFDSANQNARALDANGRLLPGVTSYWFAWYAFHPETQVFRAKSLR